MEINTEIKDRPEIIISGCRVSFVCNDLHKIKDVTDLLNGVVEIYEHGYGKIEFSIYEKGGDCDLWVNKHSKPHQSLPKKRSAYQ